MSAEDVIRWTCDRCGKVVEFTPGSEARHQAAPSGWGKWVRTEASGRHSQVNAGWLLCSPCDSAVAEFTAREPVYVASDGSETP